MKLNLLKSLNLKHSIDNTIAIIQQLGNSDICVVVPDKLSATMERLIFEKLNLDCSFNINVSTLNRFSKNILAETKAKYRTISKIGGIILLKKVLNENKNLITSFKNDKHSYQYSNEIYKTLSQLKACQLTSEELINYQCELKPLQQKINDLGNILQFYNEAKPNAFLDNSDTLTLTCMMLEHSESVKNTYYIFVGFDDFTSQGYLLIERLIKQSKGVYVNTYISNNFNKNIYYQDVFYTLVSKCRQLGINEQMIELPYIDDDFHTYLTQNLFAFNKLKFNTPSNLVRLYQAQNIVDELEFVARDIRKRVISGARFREFGVAIYNLNNYVDVVKQVFNKYDLCTYIDIQKSFSSTCVYRFFVNLFTIYLKNYETLNLIELINSPFIVLPETHKAQIIKTIKKLNYRGNLSKLDLQDEQINISVKAISKFLNTYKLDNDSTIEDILNWHNNLVENLKMNDILFELSECLDDAYDKKILAQSLKSSLQLINEIKEFYPSATLQEVLDIYTNAGLEHTISPLPLSADCIQIIDAQEILTSFDNLYIVNCSASTSPSILQDIGILLDKELSYVQLSHNIEPTIARMNRLNKFKLFNGSLMFNKSLCVSMSLNSPSETSPLVNELKTRLFISSSKNEETNISYIYPNQINNELNYTPLSLWDLVEYVYINNITPNENIQQIIDSTNIVTRPTNARLEQQFVNFNKISASGLESYFECPLKYMFRYILKLKEADSSDVELLDIGNILHIVAEKYYKLNNRTNLDIAKFCTTTITYIINSDEKLKQHINNPILINLIGEAERFISHLQQLELNSKFVPTYFEKSFGQGCDFPALKLTDNVVLNGKIDRIDIYNNHFRIIDYKSGNSNATFNELYYGKKLQLFLYALAVKNATNKQLSGTFYFPIKNSITKTDSTETPYKLNGFYTENLDLITAYDINLTSNLKSNFVNMSLLKDGSIKKTEKVLTESEMDNLLKYSKNLSVKAINEIQQGKFNASPLKIGSKFNACTYCPYLSLCSKSSNKVEFREVGDVNKQSFIGE